jgi:hypothetical protein
MRVLISLMIVLIASNAFSQGNFYKDLRSVIKDSSNCFKSFKADFKQLHYKDSVFNTVIVLEGTKKNNILFTESMCMYSAGIIDSVKEKKGRKVVDEWKDKIYSIVGGSFQLTKAKVVDWNPNILGWKFERGNLWIDVNLFPYKYKDYSFCTVVFSVTYFNNRP